MIINTVSHNLYNFNQNKLQKPAGASLSKRNYDYSCADIKAGQYKAMVEMQNKGEKFLKQSGRVTKEQYKALGKDRETVLRRAKEEIEKNYDVCKYLKPETAAKFALVLKEYLDNKNPEGYKLVSIGTSPDMVANALNFLGCDVTFVPVSSLKNIPSKNCPNGVVKNIEDYPNLEKVMKYLEYKEISGDNAANDVRKIIIIDIAHKGGTLKRFQNLLTEYGNINTEKIEQFDFMKALRELENAGNNGLFDKYNLKYKDIVDYNMGETEGFIGRLSNTPHFDVIDDNINNKEGYIKSSNKTDEELFEAFENYSTPLGRAHNLVVMDELEKLQQKREL